ncbi:MAG TPA: DnaJ domain-containing protein [Myxococcota bacterium]|nr:DnaJ domain-containing protein [Myxococcota bacterium]
MDVDYLPAFTREGRIEEIPLPVLIVHILDEKLSGRLYIEEEGTKSWIYFEEGFPAGVFAPKSQDFLGTVLRELGYIDDDAFNQSLMMMAKTKRLQGELLVEDGKIDSEQLDRALSLQLARKLARLFVVRAGVFRFAEDEELIPPMEPIRINTYALIYNGIKNSYHGEDLKEGLQILVGRSCKVSGLFVERKELFEFPPDDMADAELLREFRLPQVFVRATRSGPTSGMMMLLALLYCGMLELEEADFAVPIEGAQAPRAAPHKAAVARAGASASERDRGTAGGDRPKQGAKKLSAELVKKINDKFEQIKSGDMWQIIEVEKDAGFEVVKKSFLTLAKVYHPDRVSGAGDEEISHRMDLIFTRINEAYQVLSDPNRRAEYDKKAPSDTKSDQPRPEEARVQFQKAQVYLKKKDLTKAAEAVRWAADLDNSNGDYKAYKAWIEFLREKQGSPPERLAQAKAELIDVAKGYPQSFHAYKFLAKVSMELNDMQTYYKALNNAAKLNPKDVDIARQLRLFNMRKEKEGRGWLKKKFTK